MSIASVQQVVVAVLDEHGGFSVQVEWLARFLLAGGRSLKYLTMAPSLGCDSTLERTNDQD